MSKEITRKKNNVSTEKNMLYSIGGCCAGLALGTGITIFLVSIDFCEQKELSTFLTWFITTALIFLCYLAVDFSLYNNINQITSIEYEYIDGEPKVVNEDQKWTPIYIYLVITLAMSLFAMYALSEVTKGSDERTKANQEIADIVKKNVENQTIALNQAPSLVKSIKEMEIKAIDNGNKRIKSIVKGSAYEKLYKDQGHKINSWFWKCSDCSKQLKRFRQSIIDANKQTDQEIIAIRSSNSESLKSINNAMSYNSKQDSSIFVLNENAQLAQKEKDNYASMLRYFLFALNIMFAISLVIQSDKLREYRIKFGQHVGEKELIIFKLIDFPIRILNFIINLVFTFTISKSEKWKWLKEYETKTNVLEDPKVLGKMKKPESLEKEEIINAELNDSKKNIPPNTNPNPPKKGLKDERSGLTPSKGVPQDIKPPEPPTPRVNGSQNGSIAKAVLVEKDTFQPKIITKTVVQKVYYDLNNKECKSEEEMNNNNKEIRRQLIIEAQKMANDKNNKMKEQLYKEQEDKKKKDLLLIEQREQNNKLRKEIDSIKKTTKKDNTKNNVVPDLKLKQEQQDPPPIKKDNKLKKGGTTKTTVTTTGEGGYHALVRKAKDNACKDLVIIRQAIKKLRDNINGQRSRLTNGKITEQQFLDRTKDNSNNLEFLIKKRDEINNK